MNFKLLIIFSIIVSQAISVETKVFSNITLINNGIGNAIFVETKEGNVLIDTGVDISELTNAIPSVDYLINTHRHLDHVSGNEFYGSKGATIIAHKITADYLKGTRKAQKTNVYETFGVFKPLFQRETILKPIGLPKITFDKTYNLTVGKEKIELIYMPYGNTDGDIIVYFPEKNYIHLGDLSFSDKYPVMDINHGANIDGLLNSLKKVLFMSNEKTVFTPGHGGIMSKKDL